MSFFDVKKSRKNFLCFCGVASITCLKIFDFCGEFTIKFSINFTELRSERCINFRKMCGDFIRDFGIEFCGEFTVNFRKDSLIIY